MRFLGDSKLLLAPMAGVTDEAMRSICLEFGASLTYTEMVSAKALSCANEKTRSLLRTAPGENCVAVQLFGHDPAVMAEQAHWVENAMSDSLACIDINMGCPARKIVSKGDGSALMRDPALAERIVSAVKSAVSVPVTVKFRRGWALGEETAPEFAQRMEQAGADAMTVHGRYAQQMYQGCADRGVISRVKSAVSVPVIGNGDIRCGEDVTDMIGQTGCDAVMIARGALGNPWIFKEGVAALEGRPAPRRPTVYEKVDMARRHARILASREAGGIVRMRKHASWYMSGVPRGAQARGLINACVTLEDFERVFDFVIEVTREYEAAGYHMANTGL